MVKTFEVEETFPLSVSDYFDHIYARPDFKKQFHLQRGDLDVDVSDWIEQGPPSNSFQRICFYSMVEKESTSTTEAEVSRCLETERYEWQKDPKAGSNSVLQVYNSITPENSLGNVFKISANWIVSPVGSSECKVWLEAEVECTKRVWGLQNIAESYLHSKVSESMKSWFQQCRKEIELAKNKKKPPPDQSPDDPEFPHNAPTPASTPPEDPPTHDTSSQIRMRALNTVVSGTGKLVQMLSTSSWSSDSTTPSDEEARHGGDGGEGYLNFKVDTPHLHSDDDLDSEGRPVQQHLRVHSSWIVSVLFIVLVLLCIYYFANYPVII